MASDKSKLDRDGPTIISDSISEVASQFMKEAFDEAPVGATIAATATLHGRTFDPAKAAVFSLYCWGGGFLYLGHVITAAILFLVCFGLLLISGALAELLPAALSGSIRDVLIAIQWKSSAGWGWSLAGGLSFLTWWLSLVIATSLARRSLGRPYRPVRNGILLFVVSPLPGVVPYLLGQFWWGHLEALFHMLFAFSLGGTVWSWQGATGASPAGLIQFEALFLASSLVAIVSLTVVAVSFVARVAAALQELGWIQAGWQGAEAERKFVALGVLIILCVALYGFAGGPGRRVREKMFEMTAVVQSHGFERTARGMRKPIRTWERAADAVNDQVTLFR